MFKFQCPTTIQVVAKSGSGKSHFVRECILQEKFEPWPNEILYFYSIYQDEFKILEEKGVKFIKDFDKSVLENIQPNTLIIFDDMYVQVLSSSEVLDIAIKKSHHLNITCIILCQTLFFQGRHSRSIALNTHYLVVFGNPRDKLSFSILARQVMPQNTKFLMNIFDDATSKPYGYLICDFSTKTSKYMRYITNIFEQPTYYVSDNMYKDLCKEQNL